MLHTKWFLAFTKSDWHYTCWSTRTRSSNACVLSQIFFCMTLHVAFRDRGPSLNATETVGAVLLYSMGTFQAMEDLFSLFLWPGLDESSVWWRERMKCSLTWSSTTRGQGTQKRSGPRCDKSGPSWSVVKDHSSVLARLRIHTPRFTSTQTGSWRSFYDPSRSRPKLLRNEAKSSWSKHKCE